VTQFSYSLRQSVHFDIISEKHDKQVLHIEMHAQTKLTTHGTKSHTKKDLLQKVPKNNGGCVCNSVCNNFRNWLPRSDGTL